MIALAHFQILFFASLFTCHQHTHTRIQLQEETALTFLDPLDDVFMMVHSDTFSDHNLEMRIVSEYRASRDTTRRIICSSNKLAPIGCDTLKIATALEIEAERILILHGMKSINDSCFFEIAPAINGCCVRYHEKSYVVAFCSNGQYFVLTLSNFGSKELFSQAIKSFRVQ